MVRREIFYSAQCDVCAENLGGYLRIDQSLNAVLDVLIRNPYNLPRVESDWYSARYVTTIPVDNAPALLWTFEIQSNGDVIIDHVEEFEDY